MRKYKIENYLLHKIDQFNAVVQNKHNTILINDKKIIDFLNKLEEEEKNLIFYNEIQDFFDNESEHVLEFLIEHQIIEPANLQLIEIDSIKVVTDEETLQNILYKAISEKTNINVEVMTFKDYLGKEYLENSLIICFLNKFNGSLLKSSLNKVRNNSNCYLLLSYIYNHSVIFNCLFSESIGLPCPRCTKGILDGQVYEEGGGVTYQQLLKMIYDIDESYNIEYPLTYQVKFTIALTILKQISLLALDNSSPSENDYYQDFSNIYKLELSSNRLVRDTAIYWEMCDCYDRSE